jgi:hypothetical protein
MIRPVTRRVLCIAVRRGQASKMCWAIQPGHGPFHGVIEAEWLGGSGPA